MAEDMATASRREIVAFIGVLALGLALFVSYSLYTGVALEDAFITYRYARNLASGHGFVFNPNEYVLGTTSPLYALVLAAFGWISGVSTIPDVSAVLTILFAVGTLAFLFCILRRVTGSLLVSVLGPVIFMVNPIVLLTACGGMETSLVLLLVTGSMLSMLRERWIVSGLLSGLLVLTRIDGAIWAALLFLYSLRRSPRGAIRQGIVAAALLLPGAVLAGWYFGSPIPHTIVAKRVIGVSCLFEPLASLNRAQIYYQWGIQACRCDPATVTGLALLLGVIGVLRAKGAPGISLFVVFPVSYVLAMYVGRAPMYFEWYLAPVVVFTSSVMAIGANEFRSMLRWLGLQANTPRVAAVGLAVLLFPMGLLMVRDARREFQRSRLFQAAIETNLRRPVGLWLRDNTPPEATIAMEAIGYQGYYSDRRIVDLAGLVSPDVVRIHRASHSNAEAFTRILRELNPDYVVLRSFEVDENQHLYGGSLFGDEEQRRFFFSQYRELKRLASPIEHGPASHITIYGLADSYVHPKP